MPHWKSGTPTTTEWNGPWRATDAEAEVSHDEWLRTYDSLHEWLSSALRVGSGVGDDIFLREVWSQEHRSHVIELIHPSVLTVEFLQQLQTLAGRLRRENLHSGQVAAGLGQRRDEAAGNRVGRCSRR